MEAKKRVLVVDDEPGILKVVAIHLKLRGYETITTLNGKEALELVQTWDPNIVLLDILMPEMTGLDVLTRLREFSQVPVIAFTADSQMADKALKMGANGSIAKPCNPEMLLETIKSVLENHKDPGPF